jgi:hypothetical protein
MCVLISSKLLSETVLILRNSERDVIKKMYSGVHVKYPLFFSDFNGTSIFWTVFRKIPKQYFMKIRPVGAELLHADRRTDMTMLIFAFAILRTRLKYCTAGQLTDESMVHVTRIRRCGRCCCNIHCVRFAARADPP